MNLQYKEDYVMNKWNFSKVYTPMTDNEPITDK